MQLWGALAIVGSLMTADGILMALWPKLDTREARTDLSSRECAKLLGSTIGGLLQMAPAENVRTAIKWWAEHDEAVDAVISLHSTVMKTVKEN